MKTLLALFALIAAVPALAKTDAEIRYDVQNQLMQMHPKDSPDWWRALGPNAPSVLIQMYQGTDKPYWQQRLLQGLGWFSNDPVALDFLKQQAASGDEIVRNTAIRSVGHAAGAGELDFLEGFLKNDDPQTRVAAAETLRGLGDERANAAVDRYLTSEKVPWVASRVRGVLPRPGASLTPVASSEDRLNPELAGAWRGYRVSPRADAGLRSDQVTGTFTLPTPTSVEGKLLVRADKKVHALVLKDASGRGSRFAGSLVEEGAAVPFEATVSLEAGALLMQIHVAKTGAVFMLRREPR